MINERTEATDGVADMISTNTKYLVWNNKGGVGKLFLHIILPLSLLYLIRIKMLWLLTHALNQTFQKLFLVAMVPGRKSK